MQLRDLHWSLAPTPLSPHVMENIERILHAVRMRMEMDVAFVSEFLQHDRVFRGVSPDDGTGPLAAGDVLSLGKGYCRHVVEGRLPQLIPDTTAVEFTATIAETHALPIGAHLSVPIALEGGRIFGTLCCFSHRANLSLGERDIALLRTLGDVIATEIAADIRDDTRRRAALKAIEAAVDAGDPYIVVQPIRRLADRSLTGVECLARFAAEPGRSPDLWFAEAQSVAYGVELELLAARKALALCADLPAPLSVSINFSPDTLVAASMPEALAGFDPQRIVIEMTEHVPVQDYGPIIETLKPLRSKGMRIAIDDAGAGYSSLRHILSIRPDVIKLDIGLTRDVDSDPVRNALAAALAEFARRTNTMLVAEGIETEKEFETLRDLGFHTGQGYLLGRPQPLGQLLSEIGPLISLAGATAPKPRRQPARAKPLP